LVLPALIVIPLAIVAFLGGLLAGKRRAPGGRGASEWDVPV
jgi:hypothetical protein